MVKEYKAVRYKVGLDHPSYSPARLKDYVSKARRRGLEISTGRHEQPGRRLAGMERLVYVSVPFDWGFSKNAIWRVGKGGHVYLRQQANALCAALQAAIQVELSGARWPQRRTHLDLFVEKPTHRGDAINVLDAVADAAKRALGIDDRWFVVDRIDWAIVKADPMIFLGLGQTGSGDQQACSYCGRVLELDRFWRDKSGRLGRGRECRDCMTGQAP